MQQLQWTYAYKLKGHLSIAIITARGYAKRGICRRRVSVCVSVCLSVTLRYCTKTAKRRIMQIMFVCTAVELDRGYNTIKHCDKTAKTKSTTVDCFSVLALLQLLHVLATTLR